MGIVFTNEEEENMLLVTTEYLPGKELELLGMVKGNIVQAKNVGKDIGAGLKSLAGGELVSYSKLMEESRATATERMIQEAKALGADAIINVRYVSAAITQGASEALAYGTAVKFK